MKSDIQRSFNLPNYQFTQLPNLDHFLAALCFPFFVLVWPLGRGAGAGNFFCISWTVCVNLVRSVTSTKDDDACVPPTTKIVGVCDRPHLSPSLESSSTLALRRPCGSIENGSGT